MFPMNMAAGRKDIFKSILHMFPGICFANIYALSHGQLYGWREERGDTQNERTARGRKGEQIN